MTVGATQPSPQNRPCHQLRSRAKLGGAGGVDVGTHRVDSVDQRPGVFGCSIQQGNHITTGNVGEQGQELMPNTVPDEATIVVRRIFDRLEAKRRAELLGLGAAQPEERPTLVWSHRRQTIRPCAACEVDQESFGLVVGRVAEQCVRPERCLTGATSPCFEVRPGSDIDGDGLECGTQPS